MNNKLSTYVCRVGLFCVFIVIVINQAFTICPLLFIIRLKSVLAKRDITYLKFFVFIGQFLPFGGYFFDAHCDNFPIFLAFTPAVRQFPRLINVCSFTHAHAY